MIRKMAEQVPAQLLEEIRLAYEANTRIHQLVEGARDAIIQEEVAWDQCPQIAETLHSDVRSMYPVLKKPYNTMKRMIAQGIIISDNIQVKLDKASLFGHEIYELLENAEYDENKDEMRTTFTRVIQSVERMEGVWKAIYDYAKPVPQGAPRKERQRGGRKRRTHRKRKYRRCTHRN